MAGEVPHPVNFYNSRAGEIKGPPPPNTSTPYPLYVGPEPSLNGVAHTSRPSFRSTHYVDPNESPVSPRTQQPESTSWAHQQRSPMDHRTAPNVQRESPDFRHLHSPTTFTRPSNAHSTYASPSAPPLRDREDFEMRTYVASDRMLQHPVVLQPPIQADKSFPPPQDYSYSQQGGTNSYSRVMSSVGGEFSRPFAPTFDSRIQHLSYPHQLERRHTTPHQPGLSIHPEQRRESHTPSSSTAISPPLGYSRLSSGQHPNYIPTSDSRNTYRLNTSPNDVPPVHHNDLISNTPQNNVCSRQLEFFPRQLHNSSGVLEQGGMNRVMNENYNSPSQLFAINSKQVAAESYEPPNKRVKTEEHGGSAAPSTGEVSDQDTEDEDMFGSRPGSGTPDPKKRKYSTKSGSRSSVHRNRNTGRTNPEDIDEELPAYIDGVPVNKEWGLTKAGKARQRLPQACIACRKKKIKCIISKGQTVCEKCKQQNMLCEFKSSTSSRGKVMLENEEGQAMVSEDSQTTEMAPHSMIEDQEMSGASGLKREKDMEVPNMNYNIPIIEPPRSSTFMKGEGSTQAVQPMVTQSASLFVADPMNADLASASHISTSAQLAEFSRGAHVRDMAAQQWSGSMSRPRHSSAGVSATLSSPPSPVSTEPWQHNSNKGYYAFTRSRSTPIRGTPTSSVPGPIGEDPRDHLLPPPEHLELLCELYFTHIYSQHYQFLHRRTFMDNLRNHRRVLLYSLCAIAARFSPIHRAAEEQFAQQARQLILENFSEQKLEVVQAMVIMGLHDFGSGNGPKAWMFCGMAVRLGSAMNLNMEPKREKGQSPVEIEVQRRTYWSYYLMDRLNSYGNSRPFLTQDHDCHIQLPCDQTSFDNQKAVTTEHLKGKNPCSPQLGNEHMGAFAYLIRIVSLWGDVLKFFHLSGFVIHDEQIPTNFEPDPEFQKFVDRLQEWEKSLPSGLRFSQDNLGIQIRDGTVGAFVMMHVMFHNCSVYVYRYVSTVTIPKSSQGFITRHVSKEYIFHSIRKIFFHADTVIDIMKQVWQRKTEAEKSGEESVVVVAPFIGQAVLDACLIGVTRARHNTDGVGAAAQCEQVEIAYKWLKELKKYWKPIGPMCKACRQIRNRNGAAKLLPESSSGTGSASVSPKQIAPFEHSVIPSPNSTILQFHSSISALEFAYDTAFPGDLLDTIQYTPLPFNVFDYYNEAYNGQGALNPLAEYGVNPEYTGLFPDLLPTTTGQSLDDIDQQPQHPISTLNSTIISQSPSMTNTSTSSIQAQNSYLGHHISENNMVTPPEQPSTLLPSDVPVALSPPHSTDTSDCDDCDDEHDENEEEKPEDFGHKYVTLTTKNRMEIFRCLNEDDKEDVRKVVEASGKNILDDDREGQSGERKYLEQYTPDGGDFVASAGGGETGS